MSVIDFVTRRALPTKPVFYGQCGEDQAIFERYFPTKRNGTFLEMGALDGVLYSNTKFFEDTLGWSGVLIEPIPHNYEACCRQRPRSRVYNCIVSSSLEPMEIYVNGAVSSVKDFTTQQFYDGWHKRANVETIHAECRRLDDLLHDAKLKSIDFWSLDVEGSEYEVLKTMDWDIPVHVLCMEITGGESANMNEACRDLLRQHGFRFDGPLAHNELWIGSPLTRS
jgi:FkbM family methyltransferase